jgi:hypothetical protein
LQTSGRIEPFSRRLHRLSASPRAKPATRSLRKVDGV